MTSASGSSAVPSTGSGTAVRLDLWIGEPDRKSRAGEMIRLPEIPAELCKALAVGPANWKVETQADMRDFLRGVEIKWVSDLSPLAWATHDDWVRVVNEDRWLSVRGGTTSRKFWAYALGRWLRTWELVEASRLDINDLTELARRHGILMVDRPYALSNDELEGCLSSLRATPASASKHLDQFLSDCAKSVFRKEVGALLRSKLTSPARAAKLQDVALADRQMDSVLRTYNPFASALKSAYAYLTSSAVLGQAGKDENKAEIRRGRLLHKSAQASSTVAPDDLTYAQALARYFAGCREGGVTAPQRASVDLMLQGLSGGEIKNSTRIKAPATARSRARDRLSKVGEPTIRADDVQRALSVVQALTFPRRAFLIASTLLGLPSERATDCLLFQFGWDIGFPLDTDRFQRGPETAELHTPPVGMEDVKRAYDVLACAECVERHLQGVNSSPQFQELRGELEELIGEKASLLGLLHLAFTPGTTLRPSLLVPSDDELHALRVPVSTWPQLRHVVAEAIERLRLACPCPSQPVVPGDPSV